MRTLINLARALHANPRGTLYVFGMVCQGTLDWSDFVDDLVDLRTEDTLDTPDAELRYLHQNAFGCTSPDGCEHLA